MLSKELISKSELEVEYQKVSFSLRQKEKLLSIAHKAAHDLSSPLTALNMMMHICDELPENKRILIKRTIESILEIANDLLDTYRHESEATTYDMELRQTICIADILKQLINEKKVQYLHVNVKFDIDVQDDTSKLFVHIQKIAFVRMMSNLINNGVDALAGKNDGVVKVRLNANGDTVFINVEDNGHGMQKDKVEKIVKRQPFSEGKETGHGLGLQQVWDTLECNLGVMLVQSEVDRGTSIQLALPRVFT